MFDPIRKTPVTQAEDVDIDDLKAVLTSTIELEDYPNASEAEGEILIYDADRLLAGSKSTAERVTLCRELANALSVGPGVVAIKGATDPAIVDKATTVFEAIMSAEATKGQGADHFAEAGANQRLWNGLEKLALADPEVFIDYHGNPIVDLIAFAWLGPDYQVTTQANVINPGGRAQAPHRDYHLGFMTQDKAKRFPLHAHLLSPVLTLQGAIAHCDMAPEAGPTMVLPHSQKYPLGYLAWPLPEVVNLFDHHHVQLGLSKGDALFFNPAVIHAGGHNRTSDVRRFANLFQISSAMGRAMETVDRQAVVNAIYPALLKRYQNHGDPLRLAAAIAAAAEGYPFPTNLDRDPPVDGLTPPSQQDVVLNGLQAGTEPEDLAVLLADQQQRRLS